MTFSPAQVRRYARHILLPDVGGHGQARLLAATVAVDISTPAARIAAAYLAAAGIGTLRLTGPVSRPAARPDLLFPLALSDLGAPLGTALAARLTALHPELQIRVSPDRIPDTIRSGDTRIAELIMNDHEHLTLAGAMAAGGEAAARLVHALARAA